MGESMVIKVPGLNTNSQTHNTCLPVTVVAPPPSESDQACVRWQNGLWAGGPVPLWNCVLASLWPQLLLLPSLKFTMYSSAHYNLSLPFYPPAPPSLLIPPTHAHTCTLQVLYKGGRTTTWLQLHKHNFWQHYCTLEPTALFFLKSPYSCFVDTLPTDTISQSTEWMVGAFGCVFHL